jgi:hypothetical protein
MPVTAVNTIATPPVAKFVKKTPTVTKVVAENLGLQQSQKPAQDSFVLTLMYNFGLTIEKK